MPLNVSISGILLTALELGALWRIKNDSLFQQSCFVSDNDSSLCDRLKKSLIKLTRLPVACGLSMALLVILDAIPSLNLHPKVQVLAMRFNNSIINAGFYVVAPFVVLLTSWRLILSEIKGSRRPVVHLFNKHIKKIMIVLLICFIGISCEPKVILKNDKVFEGTKLMIVNLAVFTTKVSLMVTSSTIGGTIVYDTWSMLAPDIFNSFLNNLNVDELSKESFGPETDYAIQRATILKQKKNEDWKSIYMRRGFGILSGLYGLHLILMSMRNVLTHGGMAPADVGTSVIGLISPIATMLLPIWPVETICRFVEKIAWVFSLGLAINTV